MSPAQRQSDRNVGSGGLGRVRVVFAVIAALASGARASIIPHGPDRPVHPDHATGNQNSATIAMSPSGVSVVVWEELVRDAGDPNPDNDLFGQLFDACGDPIGKRFDVPASQSTDDSDPVVAMSSAGDFVVVWTDYSAVLPSRDGSPGHGVILQRFSASGERIDGEVVVNDNNTVNDQYPGDVAFQPDGGYVVAWQDQFPIDGGDGIDIWMRIYDAAGSPLDPPVRVNTNVADTQSDCALAIDDAGRFVIVWGDSRVRDGCSGTDISAQLFEANGVRIGSEIAVNSSCADDQRFPSAAFDDAGGFLVVWDSLRDGVHRDVKGQRFTSLGVPDGDELLIHPVSGVAIGVLPVVSRTIDGGFVVAWADVEPGDGSGPGILGRCLDAAGAPVGETFRVNVDTAGVQSDVDIASSGDGRHDFSWTGPDADGSTDIRARRFAEPTCATGTVNAGVGPIVDVLFINGSAGDSPRTLHVAAGDLVWAALLNPPSPGNGRFVIHAEASGSLCPVSLPFGIGTMCFELLLMRGGSPEAIWNNAGRIPLLGSSRDFDGPIADPQPAPTVFFEAWSGIPSLPVGTRVTFQGVMSDRGSATTVRFSVTNAVTLEIH